jgi:hypothetical protein
MNSSDMARFNTLKRYQICHRGKRRYRPNYHINRESWTKTKNKETSKKNPQQKENFEEILKNKEKL